MPTPPPWWIRHPGGAADGVDERVEQRPVGDRVGAVAHRLGLAVRRGDGAGVEVVAADDDGRRDLAARHESLKRRPASRALAVAQPADARGQALEAARAPAPSRSSGAAPRSPGTAPGSPRSVRADVLRIARQRRPAERALALAEQRPDERGHETREVEGVRHAGRPGPARGCCCRSRRSPRRRLQREHRPHVVGHRRHRRGARTRRVRAAQLGRLAERQPAGT